MENKNEIKLASITERRLERYRSQYLAYLKNDLFREIAECPNPISYAEWRNLIEKIKLLDIVFTKDELSDIGKSFLFSMFSHGEPNRVDNDFFRSLYKYVKWKDNEEFKNVVLVNIKNEEFLSGCFKSCYGSCAYCDKKFLDIYGLFVCIKINPNIVLNYLIDEHIPINRSIRNYLCHEKKVLNEGSYRRYCIQQKMFKELIITLLF